MLLAGSSRATEADGGQPGAFLRAGAGARAASLGNAFAAAPCGAEAVYWNPAALAGTSGTALASMVSAISHGRQMNFIALSHDPGSPTWGAWGLGWLNYSLGDDFEGRATDTGSFYTFGDRQDAVLLSHGRALTPWLALGATLKSFSRRLESFDASGWGSDLGLNLSWGKLLRFAVVAADLYSQQTWSTGSVERFPLTLRLAGAAELWKRRIRIFAGAHDVEGRQPQVAVGLEGWVAGLLAARIGLSDRGLSAGGGVRLKLGKMGLGFDYAYLTDPLKEGSSQRFSLDANF